MNVPFRAAASGPASRWIAAMLLATVAAHLPAATALTDAFPGNTVSGFSTTISGTTAGATAQVGEPTFDAGSGPVNSVWLTWTSTYTGQVSVSTRGSSIDTVVGVFTGATVATLTRVAFNDDYGNGVGNSSLVTFNAVNGSTYRIRVLGYSGASGAVSLAVQQTPTVSVACSATSVLEGPTPSNAVYTFTLNTTTVDSLPIPFALTGTAVNGGDYSIGSVTIPPNTLSATTTLTTIDDAASDGNKTATLTLSTNQTTTNSQAGTYITIITTPSSANLGIADDEPIFVDVAASGSNNGTSWANAFTNLASTLSGLLPGNEVWVRKGTYSPGALRTDAFQLKPGTTLYGGFAGTETLRSERDWRVNQSILSGAAGNAYHVVVGPASGSATFDGFVVRDGNADGAGGGATNSGGGLYSTGGIVALRNCLFTNNQALAYVGGAVALNSGGSIDRCIFQANRGRLGTAIWCGTTISVSSSLFLGNIADAASPNGSAIFLNGNSTVTNCTFHNNTSATGAAAIHFSGGSTLRNCIVWGNAPAQITGSASATAISSIISGGVSPYTDGGGNLTSDPVFANTASAMGADGLWGTADDGLIPTAADALNNGSAVGLPATDLRGARRNVGAGPDRGAYELGTGGRIYVKKGANDPAADGTTWAKAFGELRSALYGAEGAEIWLAAGTYAPTAGTDQSQSFVFASGTELYGGFSGGEVLRTARDLIANQTILSGDLGGGNKSYAVVKATSATGLVVDGVTIRDGAGSGSSEGGGISFDTVTGTLRNCVITQNTAPHGGGMYNKNGNLTVNSCVFAFNTTAGLGGAIHNYTGPGGTFTNCLFKGNRASFYTSYNGGAVFNESLSAGTCKFVNCTFQDNSAMTNAGGACVNYGSGNPAYTNCIFWDNHAVTAGTENLFHASGGTSVATNCDFMGGVPAGTTNGGGNIAGDPLFANAGNGPGADALWGTADDGLIPLGASPTRDAGTATGAPALDLRALSRPVGAGHDMGCYEGRIRYVNAVAGGANNGSSWANAHLSLADALAAAQSGDEIWVAKGTYKPSSSGDASATFQLAAGLPVYGGFAGGETTRSARNWIANPTILSGSIGAPGNNSQHVVTLASNTVLDGFTIRDGVSAGSGGGINANGCSNLTIANCRILSNSAGNNGGGASLLSCSGVLNGCVFADNSGGFGGALNSSSTLTLTNCVFVRNRATSNTVRGGGAFYHEGAVATLNSCVFVANASTNGTAGHPGGGAVCVGTSGTVNLTNSILWADTAVVGQAEIGLVGTGAATAQYCSISGGYAGTGNLSSNPLFINQSSPEGADGIWATADDGLRLRADSPAADSGTAGGAPSTDIMGTSRPLGGVNKFDRGAYEGKLPLVSFAVSNSTAAEGTTASIVVTLSAASDLVVTVPYVIMGGTAVQGTDYSLSTASPLSFAAGTTSLTILAPIASDGIGEDEERIHVGLGTPTNAAVGTSNTVHTVTIPANNQPVITMPASVTADEGQSASVPVTMTGTSQSTVVIRYRLTDDTGVVGTDVTAASGTISWAAGSSGTQTFSVPVTADQIAEGAERVRIDLSVDENAAVTLSSVNAWLNINDLNTAGITITDVGGGPHVSEATPGVSDSYQIRLRSQPEDSLVQLGNLSPGTASSQISDMVVTEGVAFYVNADTTHGAELWRSDGTTAGTRLVKDINPGSPGSGPTNLTAFHGYLFFVADDGVRGRELWRSDGSAGGTVLVRDIYSGSGSSQPTAITPMSNGVLFAANDGTNGTELWFADLGGASLVADIYSGVGSSSPNSFAVAGGRAYFAASNAANGRELWTSDGTGAGTRLVSDLLPGAGGSNPKRLSAVGNRVFFTAYDATNGRELWVSDGTASGTAFVKNINSATNDDDPYIDPTAYVYPYPHYGPMTELNGKLIFLVEDAIRGKEPWISDGTAAGTQVIKDIYPGSNESVYWAYPGYPYNTTLARVGGRVLFAAKDNAYDVELWATDGTTGGTVRVADIEPGSSGSSPGHLTALTSAGGDRLLFRAYNSSSGHELWISDGTGGGTSRLADVYPGVGSGDPAYIAADRQYGFPAYFSATDATAGRELFTTDGTTPGTRVVKDVNTGRQAGLVGNGAFVTSWGEILYSGYDYGTNTQTLYSSNGTPAGTTVVGTLEMRNPIEMNGRVYFDAYAGDHELWVYDPAGTPKVRQLSHFYPGDDADPSAKAVLNGKLYFVASYDGSGTYGGTTAGGVLAMYDDSADSITLILDATSCLMSGSLTAWNGRLYFMAGDLPSATGYELWTSTGAIGDASLLSDINPGSGNSWPGWYIPVGGNLCFQAYDGSSYRLYACDGSTVTALSATAASVGEFRLCGSRLYFSAYTPTEGYEPWYTDGTVGGTALLADIQPGSGSSSPSLFTQVGSRVLFAADNGTNGRELWFTDGTQVGTVLVQDINASGGSSPEAFAEVAGRLYFSADDGSRGRELWISDGTAAGTRLVRDFLPGSAWSYPNGLQRIGLANDPAAKLFLVASATDTGDNTPWVLTPAQLTITCTRSNTPYFQINLDTDSATAGYQNTITFTNLNWNVDRLVTVAALDDLVAEDSPHTTTVAHTASSTDGRLGGASGLPSETVYIQDNDTAQVVVSTISRNTKEDGTTATFSVVLNSQPTANVRVSVSSNRPLEGTVTTPAAGYLDFTNANWNSPQQVVVTGVDDFAVDGNQSYAINVSAAVSSDGKYNGIGATSVTVINVDDDTASIALVGVSIPSLLAPPAFSVTAVDAVNRILTFPNTSDLSAVKPGMQVSIAGGPNAGITGYVSVVDVPGYKVTLSALSGALSGSAGGTATIGAFAALPTRETALSIATATTTQLTATSGRLTFAGGTDLSRVRIGMSVSFTAGTNNGKKGFVTAINTTTPSIDVGSMSAALTSTASTETVALGGAAVFALRLTSLPTSQVTIPITSGDISEGSVSASSVSLDSTNWSTGVAVTVTAADDALVDGDIAYSVTTGTATSTDGNYSGKNPADVSVVNLDDDAAGIALTKSTVAVAEGGTDTYKISLTAQPSANVTLSISPINSGGQGVTVDTGGGSTQLTFTSLNWNVGQNVTVTGVGDSVYEGSHSDTIRHSMTSSDTAFVLGIGANPTVTSNITDTAPVLTIGNVSVTEGNGGGTQTVNFTLTPNVTASYAPFSVHWRTVDGTALAASDYTAVSDTTISWTAGPVAAKTVSVQVARDGINEPTESLIARFETAVGCSIAAAVAGVRDATLTILDDDAQPTVAFSASTDSAGEASGTRNVRVQLSGVSGYTVTVPYTIGGTAANVTDYSINGSYASPLSFPPGTTSIDIPVVIVSDTIDETDETVTFALGTPTNATPGATANETLTINDDDAQPRISFALASSSVNEGVGASIQVAFENGVSSAFSVSVPYAISGSATGADYTINPANASPLVFPPGTTSISIPVSALTDTVANEGNETLILTLGTPTNGTIVAATNAAHTLSIVDQTTAPTVSFAAASQTAKLESAGTATVSVSLSNVSAVPVQVAYAASAGGGFATSGTDFSVSPASPITIPAGSTSVTLTVSIVDDDLYESAETVGLTLSAPVNATLGSTTGHTFNITDNDAKPSLRASDLSALEGNADNAVNVPVTMTGKSATAVTLAYATADNTAFAPGDYTSTSGTLTWAPGETGTKTFAVTIKGDASADAPRSLRLDYSGASGADLKDTATGLTTVATSSAAFAIIDDDGANQLVIAPTSRTITEGALAAANQFTVRLSASPAAGKVVRVAISSSAGAWFTIDHPVLYFGEAGATGDGLSFASPKPYNQTVPVTVFAVENNVYDTARNVTVTCATVAADGTGDVLFDGLSGLVAVTVDDHLVALPTVSFVAGAVSVGESAGNVSLSVQPDYGSAAGFQINWNTSELAASIDHAVAGGDYTTSGGTLTWAPNDNSIKTIVIPILPDAQAEHGETFDVQLSAPIGATAGADAVVTIVDDDLPSLTIASASVVEGDSGTQSLVFTVSQDRLSVDTVDVSYATSDGTGAAGTDYTATSGILHIAPGANSGSVAVPIIGNTYYEADRTFTVTLSGPVNATISGAAATGTILDDDAAPTISVAPLTVGEGVGNAQVAITLSGRLRSQAVTVHWATADATASAPADYTASSGDVTWVAGTTGTQLVDVPVIDDALSEANESVSVVLSAAVNATIASGTAAVTILDNDAQPSVSFATASQGGSESGPLTRTVDVQLTASSGLAISVPYTLSGSAALGQDYTVSPASPLAFAPGETLKTVTITIVNDDIVEATEHAMLALGVPSNAGIGSPASHDLAISDNDTAGIQVTPIGDLTTTESGGIAILGVRLKGAPSAAVTLRLDGTAGAGEGSISGATADVLDLTFDQSTWNQWQLVTIQGLPDKVDDGDKLWLVATSTIASSPAADPAFHGAEGPDIPVRNLDADTAGVLIDTGGGVAVQETSGSDAYTITLGSKPPAGTTVAVTATADSQILVDGAAAKTIWFGPNPAGIGLKDGSTALNYIGWNQPATVVVTAVDDAVAEAASHPGVITHSASGGGYEVVAVAAVTAAVTDDDSASFAFGALAGGTPQEALGGGCLRQDATSIVGGTITFAAPPAGVFVGQTLRIGSGGADLNVGQEFTITAVAGSTVSVSGAADDVGPIPVTFFAAVPVTLSSRPTAQVSLPVSSSDPSQATVGPASLVFSADASWNQPRYATVRAVDDTVADGNVGVRVLCGASVSADPLYNNTGPSPAFSNLITLTDDDNAGLLIAYDGPLANPTRLSVSEAGATATCRVRLTARPLSNITVPLSIPVAGHGTVAPTSLLFTPANWNIDQMVTVTGGDSDGSNNPPGGTDWIVATGAPTGSGGGDGYQGLTGGEAGFPDINVRTMPSNAAPTFTAITDQIFSEDPGVRSVTVTGISAGQPGEEAQALTIRATSSNPSLIADPLPVDIATTSGASQALIVTPLPYRTGTAVITVTLTDDNTIGTLPDPARSTSRTFTITVLAVNDPPSVDLNGPAAGIDTGLATYIEGAAPVALAVADVDISDVDSANLVGATVRLAAGGGGLPPDGIQEVLSVDTGTTGILATWDGATGLLTLSGTVPLASYKQVLRTLRYTDGSDAPDPSTRTVTVRVDDGASSTATATASISGASNGVTAITVTNGGSGYKSAPAVTINGVSGGSGATATATISGGAVTSIAITAAGSGYTGGATLAIAPPPSSTAAVALVNVQPTNDAPSLAGSASLTSVTEDILPVANAGDAVSALLGQLTVGDPDGIGSQQGLAVIAADTAHGAWEYSLDAGANWLPLGSPTPLQARLLAPTSLLRFLPAAEYNGSATIAVRAWDQTSGSVGGQVPADVGFIGGATAFSLAQATCSILVTPVIDLPVADLNGGAAGIDFTAGAFVEDGAPVLAVDGAALSIVADDTGSLVSATVVLSAGAPPNQPLETLSVDTSGTAIVAAYTAATGTLVLTPPGGTPSLPVADWQKVLRTLRYANSSQTPDPSPRLITVLLDDGSNSNAPLAQSTVPVMPVNDAPVLSGGANLDPIAEGDTASAGTAVSALIGIGKLVISDADLAGIQGIAIVAADNSHGTWQYDAGSGWINVGSPNAANAVLLDGTAMLRLQPAPGFNGSVDLTVCAWDGSDALTSGTTGVNASVNGGTTPFSSATALLSITVTPVNDAPVVDLDGAGTAPPAIDVAANYPENSGPLAFAAAAAVSDIDSATLQGMTITLGAVETAQESLAVDVTGTGITAAAYNSGTGVLALTGPETTAAFQQVLRTLVYHHTGTSPTAGVRSITVVTSDGALPSVVATASITVQPVNNPPVAGGNLAANVGFGSSVTLTEGAAGLGHLTATDVDTPLANLRFRVLLVPGQGVLRNGSQVLTPYDSGDAQYALHSEFTIADLQANLIVYDHNGFSATPDGFAFRVRDQVAPTEGVGDLTVFNFTVTGLVPPIVTLPQPSPKDLWTEGDPPLRFAAAGTVSDIPLTVSYDTGKITATISAGAGLGDQLVVVANGAVTVSGAVVSVGGRAIGSISGGTGGAPLWVTFDQPQSATSTPADAQAILQAIAYTNTTDRAVTGQRTVAISVYDGSSNAGVPVHTDVSVDFDVLAVDSPPRLVAATLANPQPASFATVVDLAYSGSVGVYDPELPATILTYVLTNAAGVPSANGGATLGTVGAVTATSTGFDFTYTPATGIAAQDDVFYVMATDTTAQTTATPIAITVHITGPDETAPCFLSNAPMRALENSTLIYLPQIQGGAPAQARWTVVNPPAGLSATSMSSGNLNWTTPSVPGPAVFQYVNFGILVEDPATNRAAHQPVMLKIVVPPAGNG